MTHPVQGHALFLLQQGYSHAYVNQAISALKFYFQHVLHHQETSPHIRPKKENRLPNVLSLEEVMLVLKAVNNLKYQALLYLTYSSGLRVGEVVRLRIRDCDHSRKYCSYRKVREEKTGIHCYPMSLMRLCANISGSRNLIHGYFPGKPPVGI